MDGAVSKEFARVRMMWSGAVLLLLLLFAWNASAGATAYLDQVAYKCPSIAATLYQNHPEPLIQGGAASDAADASSRSYLYAQKECRNQGIGRAVTLLLLALYPAYVFARTSRRV